jgi:hypothetical protein
MRQIDGYYALGSRRPRNRIKRADLWLGDRLMVSMNYHDALGFIWTCHPGDGPINAPRGSGRVRATGGSRPLYRGRWPEEAKWLWRLSHA